MRYELRKMRSETINKMYCVLDVGVASLYVEEPVHDELILRVGRALVFDRLVEEELYAAL